MQQTLHASLSASVGRAKSSVGRNRVGTARKGFCPRGVALTARCPPYTDYAAFFPFSAIPTSARKMPEAPRRRALGVSHSSKNTTF